jgi:dipeptidyl aminopeptidase/acylaminoacyl peptidase
MNCRVITTKILLLVTFFFASDSSSAEQITNDLPARLRNLEDSVGHLDAKLARQLNELSWFQRLGDVAAMDKVRFTGPPPHPFSKPAPLPGSNDLIVPALTFLPRKYARAQTVPLIVFVHGEIHGNVASDEDLHVVRELIEQGYAVIAPDYRGSSGYGGDLWRQIDYGGLEIEDVQAARAFMIERHREIDRRRVGIIGWSHGGMIALLTAFAHPADYQAIYAGVPVSDLADRVQRRGKDYEELFSAPYHLGKTVAEAPDEYRRRSPAFNADKLRAPLLLHANSNDEDVPLSEVQRLIAALRQANKNFELHVYTNAPGGHLFNRLDTPLALESRAEIWHFLAKHLRPPKPPK